MYMYVSDSEPECCNVETGSFRPDYLFAPGRFAPGRFAPESESIRPT
jgi:hypothetical protein